VFYADFTKAKEQLGWSPRIDVEQGIENLFHWVSENKEQFADL
jgi:nucleoside-diphosphate-sugar epimerase